MNAYLLWLRLMDKYLINKYNMKITKAYSFIFYNKDDDGKLELVMSVHVDYFFMAGRPDTLEKIN